MCQAYDTDDDDDDDDDDDNHVYRVDNDDDDNGIDDEVNGFIHTRVFKIWTYHNLVILIESFMQIIELFDWFSVIFY